MAGPISDPAALATWLAAGGNVGNPLAQPLQGYCTHARTLSLCSRW
jgi:hypothetical protein